MLPKKFQWMIPLCVCLLAVIACGQISVGVITPTDANESDKTPVATNLVSTLETTLHASQSTSETQQCQETFQARELREPYQRYQKNEPRFTLSDDELQEYLDLMGIEAICIPPQFGAPFINVDWNEQDLPAIGRMVSLGFEQLYGDGGWSQGYLVYATYDFSFGSEYEVFASPKDFDQVKNKSIPNLINADGVSGFVRFHAGIPMGEQMTMKTYIFPFENYYVAAVINLGAYDPADVPNIFLEMEAGRHPDLMNENVALMDQLVSSIRFR
jgi:hypothetical protein